MSHWMFNCKAVSKKVSESMDRLLPLHQRMMITAHLWMCKYCNRFRSQLLILRNAIRLEALPGCDADRASCLPKDTGNRIREAMRDLIG